jgi:hypothetical protein
MFVKNDLSFEKTISMVKWALLNRSLVKKFLSTSLRKIKPLKSINTNGKTFVQSRCFTKEVEEEVWELLCIIHASVGDYGA